MRRRQSGNGSTSLTMKRKGFSSDFYHKKLLTPSGRIQVTDVTACYSAELRLHRLPPMEIIVDAHMPIAISSQTLDQQPLSDNRQESRIRTSLYSIPEWLDTVKRRIKHSIMPKDQEIENVGQWLTEEIANAASTFFEEASDLLPSEPFIYASRQGDLVAEFTPKFGSLTTIYSTKL